MKRKFLFSVEQKISREGYELENSGDIQQCEAGLSNGVYGSTQNGILKIHLSEVEILLIESQQYL